MSIKIGIDIGGVLRSKRDSLALNSDMPQPPTPNAIEVMKNLVSRYGKENLYIISKVPEESEELMLIWLRDNGMFEDVGTDPSHVYFCRLRTEKAFIASELKLNYFVDDRAEVLESMNGIVDRRIMYSANGKHENSQDNGIIRLSSWRDIEDDLLRYCS